MLISIGVLLLVMGALVAYVFIPPQVVEVPAPATDDVEPLLDTAGMVEALVEAPEGYVPPVPTGIETVALPAPDTAGSKMVAAALADRRSHRSFSDTDLSLEDLSQMLWAGIGVSDSEAGLRTVPSRGEAYPVGYYVVIDRVVELGPGLYYYLPETHELALIRAGDQSAVWAGITGQPHPVNAAATLLMTANMARGEGYRETTFQESGHVGQNLYLQAAELELSMLVMGGFSKPEAASYLELDEYHHVVYLVPMGNPGE